MRRGRGWHAGELLIRAPSITKGYWRQPERPRPFSKGWYRSGDVARDAAGLITCRSSEGHDRQRRWKNIYSARWKVRYPCISGPGVPVIGVRMSVGARRSRRWSFAPRLASGRSRTDSLLPERLSASSAEVGRVRRSIFRRCVGQVSKKSCARANWRGNSRGVA